MEPYLQLTAITGFIFLISLYFVFIRSKTRHSNSREAPEPAGARPIIGHLHLLGGADKVLHHTLAEMADQCGPIFNLRLGSHRAFVVSCKEAVKECYTTNDKALCSRPRTAATKHMCYNHAVFGFGPYSPHWREMRKIVMLELLSNSRLDILMKVLNSEIDMRIRRIYELWEENKSSSVLVDLKQWVEDLTLNVMVRVVAGKSYADASDDSEARGCREAIAQFFHLLGVFVVSDAIPFLWWLDPQGNEKAMKETGKDLDAILGDWLKEHRRRRVSGNAKGDQDLIGLMLSLEEKGHLSGFPFDAETSIKSTCLAILAGGSDTTANTLIWAISLLLNNRPALKKAKEELDLHVGVERKVNESDIQNLVYLQAIVKETLRLRPVAPLSGPREAIEDCTIAGYNVPAGTRLIINVWKIHRNPEYWTDPLVFQPERFLTSLKDVDLRVGQDFDLIPFGFGRRICPGATFGLQELHLTLARLIQAFDLETPMDQPVDMTEKPGVTVPKATPLEVLLYPRLAAKFYGS